MVPVAVGGGRCDLLAAVVADVAAVAATALTAMYTFNVTLHTFHIGRLGAAVEAASLRAVGVEQTQRNDDDDEEAGDTNSDHRCHGDRFFDVECNVEAVGAFLVLDGEVVMAPVVQFHALDT